MEERLRPVPAQTPNLIDHNLWQRFVLSARYVGDLKQKTLFCIIVKHSFYHLGSKFCLFILFIWPLCCSEGELEEVLTIYTKINKSASVFLGSAMATKTGGDGAYGTSSTATGGGDSAAVLHKRKDGSSATSHGLTVNVPRSTDDHLPLRKLVLFWLNEKNNFLFFSGLATILPLLLLSLLLFLHAVFLAVLFSALLLL
jgi:hypothetical protein